MMNREEINYGATDSRETNKPLRKVAISWEALEDAFENNAPEVHSYLHLENGEVIRVVDGLADPTMHSRIISDGDYLRIDPVSSREQYRWMERFIATVRDPELRHRLFHAVDGKGAFRRFKDVLTNYPVDRERWFVFRSERVRSCIESWLTAHGVEAIERPQWQVPSADDVNERVGDDDTGISSNAGPPGGDSHILSAQRARLAQLVDLIPGPELSLATAFMEFLRDRKSAHPELSVAGHQDEGLASARLHAPSEENTGLDEQDELDDDDGLDDDEW